MEISRMMSLEGRKCLITGGAGHIGRACVKTMQELGASVAIFDLPGGDDAQLAQARKDDVAFICCDLAEEAQVRAGVNQAVETLSGLDILIHCAAFVGTSNLKGWSAPFEEQDASVFSRAMEVNLTSAFTLVQEATPALRESGKGSVILFSSIYGMVGPDFGLYEGTAMGNPAGYNASKGGIIQLTRYLSTALAPDVRVNAISPGGVERGQSEVFVKRYNARTPLKRMAVEEDMKGGVAFLASDMSAYVTGHNLVIDGGFTAW